MNIVRHPKSLEKGVNGKAKAVNNELNAPFAPTQQDRICVESKMAGMAEQNLQIR